MIKNVKKLIIDEWKTRIKNKNPLENQGDFFMKVYFIFKIQVTKK
jgi:hypothetical protein